MDTIEMDMILNMDKMEWRKVECVDRPHVIC